MVLLTSGHVALLACTSKPKDKAVTYKSKWTLHLHDVQNVRGEEDCTVQDAKVALGHRVAKLLAKPEPSRRVVAFDSI